MGEILRVPVDRELGDRLRWLVGLRWIAIAFGAVLLPIANWWLGGTLPTTALAVTLALVVAYNLAFYLLMHRVLGPPTPREVHVWLMHAQILCDLLALTAALHFSGGLENPFSVYYVLIVAVGSILMAKRDGYLYAVVATALWVGLLVAEAQGWLVHHNLAGFRLPVRYREASHIIVEALVLATSNLGVAMIGSSIVERLREGEARLYESNMACELRADELRDLNLRLQELDQSRALFIRLVTHELRAPVAAIKSYLRLILDGYVPEERFREIVEKSEQRAGDQLALIEDLLDLARAREPKTDALQPVNVADVLRDVLDLMDARIHDQRLRVEVDIGPGVPVAVADPAHVKQVWMNLVSNAVKYTPEGGHVRVTLGVRDGAIRGEVRDSGIGIKPEELEHIFEDFYRTDTAKEISRQGTGLGLSIVRGVLERYGGSVCAESEYGEGSTFRFTLPQWAGGAR